jgi:CSLREA domain-containing protein
MPSNVHRICCLLLFSTAGFLFSPSTIAAFDSSRQPLEYSVTTLADSNDGVCNKDCSLREAVATAAPDSVITFASALSGVISLKTPLIISRNLAINGPGIKSIIISGNNSTRVFLIHSSIHFTIRNLTIADGSVEGKMGATGELGKPGHAGENAEGAGLFNNGGVVTVENCTFRNNRVRGGAGGRGGFGISAAGMVASRRINGGIGGIGGDGLGGAIYNTGTLHLINCTFSGNRAIGGAGGDGGMLSGLPDEEAFVMAGRIVKIKDIATIVGDGGNGGNGYGGAIYSASDAWILNCTLVDNGALAAIGGMGHIRNGMPGQGLGSALYRPGALLSGKNLAFNRSQSIFIKNTLIVKSTSGSNCEAAIRSGGYNIDSDGSCRLKAAGDQVIPSFIITTLADNGGPTPTHALLPDSAAVKGGDPAGCVDPDGKAIITDQRGHSRPQEGRCDIGAFELSK